MCDRGEPASKQRRLTDLWRGTVSAETDVELLTARPYLRFRLLKLQVFVLRQLRVLMTLA